MFKIQLCASVYVIQLFALFNAKDRSVIAMLNFIFAITQISGIAFADKRLRFYIKISILVLGKHII